MDYDKLNSLTKYPSIPTYHALGEKGRIPADAEPQVVFDPEDEVIVTEKVDGTNGRVIFVPDAYTSDDDWFVGSREELLTARGDRIPNNTLGIAEALTPLAWSVTRKWASEDTDQFGVDIVAVFAEVFGVKGAGTPKRYTKRRDLLGARIFDVARAPQQRMASERADIASWREHGGQRFLSESELLLFTTSTLAESHFQLTPRLLMTKGAELPTRPAAVLEWLQQFAASQVVLDAEADGRSEGVVIRTPDRSKIAKIRFDDYRRII